MSGKKKEMKQIDQSKGALSRQDRLSENQNVQASDHVEEKSGQTRD